MCKKPLTSEDRKQSCPFAHSPTASIAHACSSWLLCKHCRTSFLERSCCAEPVSSVAAVQRNDIPLSAVDFHVSSIVQSLLQQQAVAQAASDAAAAGAGTNAETVLQRAMWRFRSSLNRKQHLLVGSRQQQWLLTCPQHAASISQHLDKGMSMQHLLTFAHNPDVQLLLKHAAIMHRQCRV